MSSCVDWETDVTGVTGAELVVPGLRDLALGRTNTIEALTVSIGAPRLRAIGFDVPPGVPAPEHALYDELASRDDRAAHSAYNALVRRLVSFERAMEACVRRTSSR